MKQNQSFTDYFLGFVFPETYNHYGMEYTYKHESDISSIINAFNLIMDWIIANKMLYIVHPDHDFKVSSILTFDKVLKLIFRTEDESLSRMLISPEDSGLSWDVSSSALSAARQKIRISAFLDIFSMFNRETRRARCFKGMQILACDGSEIAIHGSPTHGQSPNPYRVKCRSKGKSNEKEDLADGKAGKANYRNCLHLNAVYDVLEETYVDFLLQPGSEKDEDTAFLELCKHLSMPVSDYVVVCDRGYEAHMTFFRLCRQNVNFVIRIKDESSSRSVLEHYPDKPDTDEYDITCRAVLAKNARSALMKRNGQLDRTAFKFLPQHARYEEFDQNDQLFLTCRLVRFRLYKADGTFTYETLMTNLPADIFSTEDLIYIYHMRWACELGFESLKYNFYLKDLHSRKPELIEQEIYAKATLHNLCSRIRNCEENEKFRGSLEEDLLPYFKGYSKEEAETAPDTKPSFTSRELANQAAQPADADDQDSDKDSSQSAEQKENDCLSAVPQTEMDGLNVFRLNFTIACGVICRHLFTWTRHQINEISRVIAEHTRAVHLRRPDTRMKTA